MSVKSKVSMFLAANEAGRVSAIHCTVSPSNEKEQSERASISKDDTNETQMKVSRTIKSISHQGEWGTIVF